MTIPEPSYLTAEALAANTFNTALAALAEADRTKLIQRAEGQIDAYVGRQPHHPDDENTDRVFPRECDFDAEGTALIPLQVSLACLAQVEYLYREWWSVRETGAIPVSKDVESESIGGDGSYSAVYGSSATRPDDMLCAEAKNHLSGFVSRFVALSVTDPDHVPPVR